MELSEKIKNLDPQKVQETLKTTIQFLTYCANKGSNMFDGYEWRECGACEVQLNEIYQELFNESAINPPQEVGPKRTLTVTTVDFTGGGDGVYALYVEGKRIRYGDYYHDKIQNWIDGFKESLKFSGAIVIEEEIKVQDEDLINEVSYCGGIPPENLNEIKQ